MQVLKSWKLRRNCHRMLCAWFLLRVENVAVKINTASVSSLSHSPRQFLNLYMSVQNSSPTLHLITFNRWPVLLLHREENSLVKKYPASFPDSLPSSLPVFTKKQNKTKNELIWKIKITIKYLKYKFAIWRFEVTKMYLLKIKYFESKSYSSELLSSECQD